MALGRVPTARRQRRRPVRRHSRLDGVDLGPALRSQVDAELGRPPSARSDGTAPWGSRVMASTRSIRASPSGRLAEDVEPAADLGVLERAQVAVDVEDQWSNVVVARRAVPRPRSRWIAASTSSSQTWRPQRRQLGRVEAWTWAYVVEELLEAGQLVVGVGPGHRGQQVVDDHGVGPALGLGPLARVVDDERVQERHVAERGVGQTPAESAIALARQPLEGAVLADVHDGVGAPDLVDSHR